MNVKKGSEFLYLIGSLLFWSDTASGLQDHLWRIEISGSLQTLHPEVSYQFVPHNFILLLGGSFPYLG